MIEKQFAASKAPDTNKPMMPTTAAVLLTATPELLTKIYKLLGLTLADDRITQRVIIDMESGKPIKITEVHNPYEPTIGTMVDGKFVPDKKA